MTPGASQNPQTGKWKQYPCGKCPACCARRVSGWSFRLLQEDKRALSSHFLTLTFDTHHVPISQHGFMSLEVRPLQLFFKRLRKAHENPDPVGEVTPTLKYYAVGEYGGKSKRPHYHVILFNANVKLIDAAWPLGTIHYGTVSGASVGYTLKYVSKKSQIPAHKNDDRLPEFAVMSKGLGSNYLTDAMITWHQADPVGRMYCNLPGDQKISMPRYYKNKIYSDEQREQIGIILKMEALRELNELEKDPNFYEDRAEFHKAAFRKAEISKHKGESL